jgi:hypothetical protein
MALPPIVLAVAAAYASNRALLSAGEISLVPSGAVPAAVLAVPGNALATWAPAIAATAASFLGDSALALRMPALAISIALVVAVARIAAKRASPAAGIWAALALLAVGSFVQFIDARLLVLPAAFLALALVGVDTFDETRPGALAPFVVCALAAVYLDVSYVFAVLAVCLGFALESKRQRLPMAAVIVVALVSVAIGVDSALSSADLNGRIARFASLSAVLRQPFYALAFLQSTYAKALGLLMPPILLLFLLTGRVLDQPTVASPSPLRRFLTPALLAGLPIWAFAPVWILGGNVGGAELLPVSIGCCVLLGIAADALGATTGRVSFVAGTAALVLLAFAAAGMRDPAVTLRRDLDQHRSRFALLDWERAMDDNLPIVVANQDVKVQLTHYAPLSLASRLAYLNPSSENAETFVTEHRTFYVFEGSEVRSPLLMWLARRGLTLSQSRSFVPRDQSIDAAAFLYRVDLE